jgi:predicted MPP superfamily phosphohydrolase
VLESYNPAVSVVAFIFAAIGLSDFIWWGWADARLRRAFGKSGKSLLFRGLVGLFTLSQVAYLITVLMGPRWPKRYSKMIPMPFIATVYIWSLLVLPVCIVAISSSGIGRLMRKMWARRDRSIAEPVYGKQITRRQALTTAAVAVPPIVAITAMMRAMPQLEEFRLRRMQLRIADLPKKLDGLRIAHISDLHVGRYTRPGVLARLVSAVNQLQADLVLFTGDLIDYSLDDLPLGIDTLRGMNPGSGMFLIEGNHDLIQDPDEFDNRVRDAGQRLLIDEAMTIEARGERVQLLGARWGAATGDRRKISPRALTESVEKLAAMRDPQAFPILMVHHPNAFDAAATAGFPLVLSGHTHGGQIMLSKSIGFGPMFYRYWSGWYEKENSQIVVNNGIGNWFPLRINAPAEIIEITLRTVIEETISTPSTSQSHASRF